MSAEKRMRIDSTSLSSLEVENLVCLRQHYLNMLHNGPGYNVTFEVGLSPKVQLQAHREILMSRSKVFERQFLGDFAEGSNSKQTITIVVTDVDEEAMRNVLQFCYTNTANLTADNVMSTLYAAMKYELEPLRLACVQWAENHLNDDTCCLILQQAELFHEQELAAKCVEWMRTHFSTFWRSPAFCELPKSHLVMLLARDDLVADEIDVFHGVVAWGRAECVRRQHSDNTTVSSEAVQAVLSDVLPLIRFPLLTEEEIARHVASSGLLSSDMVAALFQYAVLHRLDSTIELPEGLHVFSCIRRITVVKGPSDTTRFRFSSQHCDARVTLSEDGSTATNSSGTSFTGVRGNEPMTHGIHSWEVELVTARTTAYVMIGVCSKDAGTRDMYATPHAWAYYSYNGKKYHHNVTDTCTSAFLQGDTMGLVFDADKGTLTVLKNGKNPVLMYDNIPKGVFPYVEMYNLKTVAKIRAAHFVL